MKALVNAIQEKAAGLLGKRRPPELKPATDALPALRWTQKRTRRPQYLNRPNAICLTASARSACDARKRYDGIGNIGVVCVVFRLKRSVSPYFWINISDRRLRVPGIVEFSNLCPAGDTVVYVPYYMPTTNPKFAREDVFFRNEAFGYLKLLNSALTDNDLIAVHVGRLRFAQPVFPPGFARRCTDQNVDWWFTNQDTCSIIPKIAVFPKAASG